MDLDELGLHLQQLHFDDENNILAIQLDPDENGDFKYDIGTYYKMCKTIKDCLPPEVSIISTFPNIILEMWNKEDLQKYIDSLQRIADGIS